MKLNRKNIENKRYPSKVIQFGEGNFLRAFVDWIIFKMNDEIDFESGVTVVQPIEQGLAEMINDQDGLYTLFLQGIKNGEPVRDKYLIDVVNNCINPYSDFEAYMETARDENIKIIVSNTTESGIAYLKEERKNNCVQTSYPAKLLAWLYERYNAIKDRDNSGVLLLPCELIESNGDKLKEILNTIASDWSLEEDFIKWLNNNNTYCNTLVDRIVTGYPRDRIDEICEDLGYNDNLVVEGEQFHLWVIEGPEEVREMFPADKAGLNVVFTDDLQNYRTRKVRVLNGAHTSMVPVGLLSGIETVGQAVGDDLVGKYIDDIMKEEISATIDLPEDELKVFVADVMDRFRNPYIKHMLSAISLNSNSKYETRVLPSILDYIKIEGKLPKKLLFGLASLITFYRGSYQGKTFELKDDQTIIQKYANIWTAWDESLESAEKIVKEVLSMDEIWKMDLNDIEGFHKIVSEYVYSINVNGIKKTLETILKA
jgi:tagaturonate reductase